MKGCFFSIGRQRESYVCELCCGSLLGQFNFSCDHIFTFAKPGLRHLFIVGTSCNQKFIYHSISLFIYSDPISIADKGRDYILERDLLIQKHPQILLQAFLLRHIHKSMLLTVHQRKKRKQIQTFQCRAVSILSAAIPLSKVK